MWSFGFLFSVAFLSCFLSVPANACDIQPADIAAPKLGSDCQPRAGWLAKHERFVVLATQNTAQVAFLGDSITAQWRWRYAEHFQQEFGNYQAVNLGLAGDRTQHVLWRVENGLFESFTPKVVVLMIGTNNARKNPPSEVVAGIRKIVDAIHERSPATNVLLHAIFPRGAARAAAHNNEVNAQIAAFHDGLRVHFLDIGALFLDAEGSISRELMPDLLHLSLEGYQVWGDAIREPLATLTTGE